MRKKRNDRARKDRRLLAGRVSLTASALAVSGIFTIEPEAYSGGNITYLTLPAALLLMLAVFLLVTEAMDRSCARDLPSLMKKGLGSGVAKLLSLPVMLFLVVSAANALYGFVIILYSLFFEGIGFLRLLLYISPTVALLAGIGQGALERTALVFAVIFAAVLALNGAASAPQFELYRLAPFPGKELPAIAGEVIRYTAAFLPAFISLLMISDDRQQKELRKTGLAAVPAAAAALLVSQLTAGLSFTYGILSKMFMPLFKAGHLSMFETHLIRFDKLAYIVSLNSALITAAFYLKSSVRVFEGMISEGAAERKADREKPRLGSNPNIEKIIAAAGALAMSVLILLRCENAKNSMLSGLSAAENATLILSLSVTAMLIAASASAAFKSQYKKEKGLE